MASRVESTPPRSHGYERHSDNESVIINSDDEYHGAGGLRNGDVVAFTANGVPYAVQPSP
eukprot:CAMPEP_0118943468 /NCGR_PEP_ID=MMETSP1169-20130426/38384_1 /TAXON_ID=36882 /ORGANISM="Pyramimonas obovata, Strain CCMP722" /LENGTH=59 /DNA_ID=CAMNT_0006888733 /DNA_START=43 /DNA_END=219 /DNA_ORIENTATION=-